MLDRVAQFALVAAAQAVAEADLQLNALQRQDAGVFLGTGMGGGNTVDDGYRALATCALPMRNAIWTTSPGAHDAWPVWR